MTDVFAARRLNAWLASLTPDQRWHAHAHHHDHGVFPPDLQPPDPDLWNDPNFVLDGPRWGAE